MLLHLFSGAVCTALAFKIAFVPSPELGAYVAALGWGLIGALQLSGISRAIERRLVG